MKTTRKAGFRQIGEVEDSKTECRQRLAKYKKVPLETTFRGITYDKMVNYRQKINVVAGNLWQISAEVEMKLGPSKYTRGLKRIIDRLELYRGMKLDDAVY